MGKGTDKLYITHSEWSNQFSEGGMSFGGAKSHKPKSKFKRLPFSCCALSLQPFENPVCNETGVVFDLINIIPWLKKYKNVDPVTGGKLEPKDLIHLKFHKNSKGSYHCPVTFKEFNEHTHIVAIKPSGNVYAYEAVEKLNIEPKHWRDLLDESISFKRKDIITIQDPKNLEQRNLDNFWYIKNDMDKPVTEEEKKARQDVSYKINASSLASKVMKELQSSGPLTALPQSGSSSAETKQDALFKGTHHYSTGQMAASFTSTSLSVETKSQAAEMDSDEFMYKEFLSFLKEEKQKVGKGKKSTGVEKGKGYVRLKTNLGDLNLELFCDQTPRTCHNFLTLCKSGYYNNVTFHRLIKNFMVQGGDPTGTGRGGESCWKKNFPDEIRQSLSHDKRGLMSMANRGRDTNGSQFFITFKPCQHLDGKHTIFGKLVGGFETLDNMERSPADPDTDKPLKEIKILETEVFVDPFEDFRGRYERRLKRERAEQQKKDSGVVEMSVKEKREMEGTWLNPPPATKLTAVKGNASQASGGGVGKYISVKGTLGGLFGEGGGVTTGSKRKTAEIEDANEIEERPVKGKRENVPKKGGFGDFSSW